MALRAVFQSTLSRVGSSFPCGGGKVGAESRMMRVTEYTSNPVPSGTTALANLFATRGMASQKHKSLLKHAKGYRGRSKNCYRIAVRRVEKAWQYAYRDRKNQRRAWRKLWIQRLQAGVRQYSWSYSRFIPSLQKSDIHLNRKVLAELAATEPFAFKAVVDVVSMMDSERSHGNARSMTEAS